MMPTPEQLELWIGRDMVDRTDDKVGRVADVYLDEVSGAPEWIAVVTGLFGRRISFVPLAGASEVGDQIKVAHEKSLIKDSPNIEHDGELSREDEERLYRHYGLPFDSPRNSGATSVATEITPEMARTRLRKSERAAVDFIDLEAPADSPVDSAR